MQDIIIVGAGTAGLSAAIYALRAGAKVTVFEAQAYGGQIVNAQEIENYPGIAHISGYEFATNLYNQAKDLGMELKYERVVRIDNASDHKVVRTEKGEYPCKAVILATGAKNRPLGLDRETELIGKGISYCATCDGAFFRNKNVAVVGGGNTALEDAIFLTNFCSRVYLIHRRDAFRAENKVVESLKQKENVEFVLNSTVTQLMGEEKISAIVTQDKLTGERREIPVSALFIAVGQAPDNGAFSELVELDSAGYISADESCTTKTDGIFTAGDCRTKSLRQLTTAASDGAVAGLAAVSFLSQA